MSKSIKELTVKETWQEIERVMNENPQPFEGLNAVYQYDIIGEDGGTYQLHLADGKARVVEGEETEADCTLTQTPENFKDMISGNLNGTAAFMTGKLKVKGSIGLAMKLEGILRQYDVNQYT
ncbi:SCP2 sterol-binding domain-containing protein [Bacillus sp. T33-2]|uniref:SCP2 sterol-binding domain-containing protein n=1 Tax=Bacillus sp. T33-2 TaxID=2054168 RepID=UPI000C772B63|nr:SCP2 sterol-binding domain-containing protein [Bacillus sp. T33-2]PLR96057.1 sterol-binding protein [Bacillus sp. T33-2]